MFEMGRVGFALEMRSHWLATLGTPKANPSFVNLQFRCIYELV